MTPEEAERLFALAREADFLGADRDTWLERLSPERDALEAAVRRLAESGDDAACELAANVWRLWFATGDVSGGRRVLAAALSHAGPPSRARALALYADGVLAFREGKQSESQARNEAALDAARAVDDKEAWSLALVGLSRVAFRDGEYERVRSLANEARWLTRSLEPEAGVMPLHMLAAGTRLGGQLDDAVELYTESLELNRRLGDTYMAAVEAHNLGHVEIHRGNIETAELYFAQCEAARSTDNPYDAAMTNLNQASLAFAAGRREEAVALLSRTQSTLDEAGIALDPDDQFEVDWLRERL